jgi:hypothetical protein
MSYTLVTCICCSIPQHHWVCFWNLENIAQVVSSYSHRGGVVLQSLAAGNLPTQPRLKRSSRASSKQQQQQQTGHILGYQTDQCRSCTEGNGSYQSGDQQWYACMPCLLLHQPYLLGSPFGLNQQPCMML